MKASAALLAGLLAGLALGGASYAQPPSTPMAIAQAEDEEPIENPTKGMSAKAARCAMACQAPSFQCYKGCGRENVTQACTDKCAKKYDACISQCGVDPKKLK
jgi:hypothetical protein